MATMETPVVAPEPNMVADDAKIEELLGQKLKEGYTLMEATCPKCAVPLVKNHQMVPKSLSMDENEITKTFSVEEPILVPSQSFEQPFKPVDGVPMCVGCDSHVITSETEIAILEQGDTLKDKGTIYVALEAATEPTTPATEPIVDTRGKQAEVINLENVTEDDVLVGSHRSKFSVDIESVAMDSVEMVISPKMGDEAKPIVIEEVDEDKEVIDEEEQNARRELATKVLGAKMLQGWTLKEKTCDSCSMPMMEYKSKESCPVCPALAKRAKKLLKQQQKLELEAQAKKDLVERTEQFETIQAIREEVEVRALKDDEDATQRAEERKRAILEEKDRIIKLVKGGPARAVDEEEKKDEESAQDRAGALMEEKMELERLEAIAKEEEERRELQAKSNGKESEIALMEAKAKQEAAEMELAKEAAAIEAFDDATIVDDKTEAMKKDQLVEEHRKNVAHKAALDNEVAKLEEERLQEAMEARRIAEERRIESENRMIAALEADAAVKALAAEDAIRRAKAALQEVSDTKQQIISHTIKLAEQEALAEAEDEIKSRFEKYSEPVKVQSEEEIYQERWETLRLEGRAIMTRRVLMGWSITPEACLGCECHNSPLIEKDGIKECVVCGGSGSGKDGAYAPVEKKTETVHGASHVPPSVAKSMAEVKDNNILGDWLGNGQEAKFEEMRKIYAMEMGKKMLAGWKIVDSSCPNCVMPMMMDDKGNTDICIVKGCKGSGTTTHAFDASTIATRDMADLHDEASLVSTIMKQAPKQQKRRKPVVSSDPPAYKPNVSGIINKTNTSKSSVIPLPADLADANAIRESVGEHRQAVSPSRLVIDTGAAPGRFRFDDNDYVAETKVSKARASKPFPEKPPRSPAIRQLSPVYGVRSPLSPRSPRDDVSVLSRASTVASDALESIYDRIEQCKLKLLDPNNSIDEQIATAALLEKLAQAAVAMKEMECIE